MSAADARKIWLKNRRDFWLLRAVALIISILLWITVLGGKKVEITKKVTLNYRLPPQLVVANGAPTEVYFRISGPRAFIKDLEAKPQSIPIDLSSAKVGDYEVLIREDMLDVPLGLKVLSVSQSTIGLKIDRVSTKRVPIRAVFAGTLPEGFKVTSVTFKPSTVEIQGARSRLLNIESVPTDAISLSPNSLRQELEVRLNTSEIPGVTLGDNGPLASVVVELQGSLQRKWFRGIKVGLRIRGGGTLRNLQNASTLGVRLRPAAVSFLLEGPDKIIERLTEQDIEVWAEIPELRQGNYRSNLEWRMAPEIRVVRRSSDWVDVSVPPLN
jgi:YbbR domain-containing protein